MTTPYILRDRSSGRIDQLRQELIAMVGEDRVPNTAKAIVRTQYCQQAAASATSPWVSYGEAVGLSERSFIEAIDELVRCSPGLNLARLNAIITAYQKSDILEELIDTLVGFSVHSPW